MGDRIQEIKLFECSTCGRIDFAPFKGHFSLGQRCCGVVRGFTFIRKDWLEKGELV